MKTFLTLFLISAVICIQDWHVGQWNFKNIPAEEYKISQETIDLTKKVMSTFYINLADDFTYEMEIKGTIHTGKYKFNKDQTELTVMSNVSGALKFPVLRRSEKEMVLKLFDVYTVVLEKAQS